MNKMDAQHKSLADLAQEALRELILDKKLSPGDLIKLLASQGEDKGAVPFTDFVIRLAREEE